MDTISPKRLLIEATNDCNAACDYCLRRYMGRPIFHLPIQDFKKWVRSAPYAEWVQPQGIGEPLLYPWILEALEYAKRQGKKTMFYTNASLLTRTMTEGLLAAGLDSLTFSVDGWNERSFQSRTGLSWKRVLKNIEVFQHLKEKGGYPTKTTIRATITRHNKFHIPKYHQFWKGRVDQVGMMPEVQFPTPAELDKTPWAHGTGFQCYHIFDPGPRSLTPVITILNSGAVVLCCQDWFSDYVMGNLYLGGSMLDIFNNDRFKAIRSGMTTGQRYPYLCEFCRLAKVNKAHRRNPYRLFSRLMGKISKATAFLE